MLQYGFAIGISSLALALFAPIFGTYAGRIGAKTVAITGAYITGAACMAFSTVEYIESITAFLWVSYLFR